MRKCSIIMLLIINFLLIKLYPYYNNFMNTVQAYNNVHIEIPVNHSKQSINKYNLPQTIVIGVVGMKEAVLGFTLSEVLITLTIIGVVAAIVIPIFITNIQNAQYKVAYRKAFSIGNQAWTSALTDNLIISRTNWSDLNASKANFNAFKSKFIIAKDCSNNNNGQCWNNSGEKFWLTWPDANAYTFIDSNGMSWTNDTSTSNGAGNEIMVDINGLKGPNKFGRDRFIFDPVSIKGPSDLNNPGIAVRLNPLDDVSAPDLMGCLSGNCYFKSWLLQ